MGSGKGSDNTVQLYSKLIHLCLAGVRCELLPHGQSYLEQDGWS